MPTVASPDEEVQRLVRERVREPILASAWFHVVGPELPNRGAGMAVVFAALEWAVRFFVKKRLWRMPLHSYWVVTPSLLHVFEFRFGASTRLRRQVGAWGRAAVETTRGTEPNSIVVKLPGAGRAFEMQGDRFASAEAEVIRLMAGST